MSNPRRFQFTIGTSNEPFSTRICRIGSLDKWRCRKIIKEVLTWGPFVLLTFHVEADAILASKTNMDRVLRGSPLGSILYELQNLKIIKRWFKRLEIGDPNDQNNQRETLQELMQLVHFHVMLEMACHDPRRPLHGVFPEIGVEVLAPWLDRIGSIHAEPGNSTPESIERIALYLSKDDALRVEFMKHYGRKSLRTISGCKERRELGILAVRNLSDEQRHDRNRSESA